MTKPMAPAAMLASSMKHPVTGAAFDAVYNTGEWMADEKLDGHRCLVAKEGDHIASWSREGSTSGVSKLLPASVLAGVRELPDGIYDGELYVPGGNSWTVATKSRSAERVLVLFDVLHLMGESLLDVKQVQRRDLLKMAVQHVRSGGVQLVPEVPPTWASYEAVRAREGEGLILKRKAAIYKPGHRGDAWIKVKERRAMTCTITGFKAGSYGPHAVILLTTPEGKPTKAKTKNFKVLKEIAQAPESFVGQRLVIQYQQLTPSGLPRHGMWDHVAGEAE